MKILIPMLLFTTVSFSIKAQEKQPSAKHFWHTTETSALPNTIWSIWVDVANWKDWDTGLTDASINEPVTLGTKGQIVSLEGRKSKFEVVEYDQDSSYTFRTKLPLGSLYVKRFLDSKDGKTFFTHEVWFSGLTSGIFAKKFGSDFKAMLPQAMDNIKKIAEKR